MRTFRTKARRGLDRGIGCSSLNEWPSDTTCRLKLHSRLDLGAISQPQTGGRSSAISRSLFFRILSSVPSGNSSTM